MKSDNAEKRFKLKIWHILLFILLAVIITVGFFAYINRENLSAMYYAYKTSSEDITAQQEENNRRIQETLSGLTDTRMRELTEEERIKLRDGELTMEQALGLIMGRTGNKAETATGTDSAQKDLLIAQIYVLRADYINRIDGLIASVKSSYLNLAPSERTMSAKIALADSLIAQGNALEGECDAQMNSILDSLAAELKRTGESTAVVAEIRSIYAQEKRLKKAALVSQYY